MSKPDSILVDHGKIYMAEHFFRVCRQLGVSVRPARDRHDRDNGSLERLVRTMNGVGRGSVAYEIDPHTRVILPKSAVAESFSGQESDDESR